MQYCGGKFKIRREIAAYLESIRKPNQLYFEPFVGGAWVLQEVSGNRLAGDANVALITLYKALQEGWQPPDSLSEEDYRLLKDANEQANPLTAFAGFGCSFAGKYFGGYARDGITNYAKNARNSLLRQLPRIREVEFSHGLYSDYRPEEPGKYEIITTLAEVDIEDL